MGACSISKKEIILGGLNCAHCAEIINDKVSKLEEIESCNLNFLNKKLTIEINKNVNENLTIEKVIQIRLQKKGTAEKIFDLKNLNMIE